LSNMTQYCFVKFHLLAVTKCFRQKLSILPHYCSVIFLSLVVTCSRQLSKLW
jgi:hypothetical protein